MLTEITVENFRCFHEAQTAPLGPLTLLVGENSTGKTSFMAMIRAMWEMAHRGVTPDFKATPYDLGSFVEIAHSRGAGAKQANTFKASIRMPDHRVRSERYSEKMVKFSTEFVSRGTVPVPMRRHLSRGSIWIDQTVNERGSEVAILGTDNGEWKRTRANDFDQGNIAFSELPWRELQWDLRSALGQPDDNAFAPVNSYPSMEKRDLQRLVDLIQARGWRIPGQRPYASAPVRSTPQRTYDPARPFRDPLGDYVPMYLAETAAQNGTGWEELKVALEEFGRTAGLFDEIRIYRFGKNANAPFQIQVRKGDKRRKGQWRNLIDVGYGVSQILPVITELSRPDAPRLSLWQQPEVHLHPSAQAALATFFCRLAADGKQLIVETHGDYLIDRVRMDVRDGKTALNPEDVSVLYFERIGLDVQIHSLRFDEQGNVLNAPPGYRQFFLEEVNRSLGL